MQIRTFLYPKTSDSTFDMEYYTSTHMPLLAEALGDACQSWGAATITSGEYEAMGWAMVTSADAFDAAMAVSEARIRADMPNYTNVQPTLLVGEYAGGTD